MTFEVVRYMPVSALSLHYLYFIGFYKIDLTLAFSHSSDEHRIQCQSIRDRLYVEIAESPQHLIAE